MGYDERHQPSSSGAVVAIAVAVLLVVGLGIVALIGAGLFIWQDFGGVPQVAVVEQQAVVQLHDSEEIQADAMDQLRQQEANVATTPDPRLNFVLKLDREGNISVDDETIGLDELKTRLVKAKGESSDEFLLRIIADPGCPKRHIKSVVAVLGDAAWHIVSPENADAPLGELNNVPHSDDHFDSSGKTPM